MIKWIENEGQTNFRRMKGFNQNWKKNIKKAKIQFCLATQGNQQKMKEQKKWKETKQKSKEINRKCQEINGKGKETNRKCKEIHRRWKNINQK